MKRSRRRARTRIERLERKPHAVLARAAVAVLARVQRRQERRHRVRVRVVQLDAIEARQLRARARRSRTRRGRTVGSSRMCGRCMSVTRSRYPKRSASSSRGVRTFAQIVVAQRDQRVADRRPHRSQAAERIAMPSGDLQEPPKILLTLGPPFDRQKIDQLNEERASRRCWRAAPRRRARADPAGSGRARSAAAARSACRGRRSPRRRCAPGRPTAKRSYQSSTSSVTMPSSVARQGTIAGTHVRSSSLKRPATSGENRRDLAASSAVGQRASGSGCLMVSGGCHMSERYFKPKRFDRRGATPTVGRRGSQTIPRVGSSRSPDATKRRLRLADRLRLLGSLAFAKPVAQAS